VNPADLPTLLRLALAHEAQGWLPEAADAWRRAVELAPDQIDHQLGLARVAARAGRLEEAQRAASAAVRLDPAEIRGQLASAEACEAFGDADGLERHARAALALQPQHLAPYYALARAGRAGVEELEQRLAELEPQDPGELHLRFALGHAHDRAGEAEQAFRHFARANRLKGAHFDPAGFSAELAAVERTFEAARRATAGPAGEAELEPILVVGLPRSGSSLVEEILSAHPAVHPLGENLGMQRVSDALGYWPDRLGSLTPQSAAELADAYRTAAQVPRGARVVTDKTLANLGRLPLIAALFPRARVLHVRRHPGDAGLSAFSLHFAEGSCTWTYDLEHIAAARRACEGHLERWREIGALPHLELPYEALVSEPRAWTERLLAFCGLAWDDACLRFHARKRAVSTPSAAQVRQPVHRRAVGRWRAYARWIGPLLDR